MNIQLCFMRILLLVPALCLTPKLAGTQHRWCLHWVAERGSAAFGNLIALDIPYSDCSAAFYFLSSIWVLWPRFPNIATSSLPIPVSIAFRWSWIAKGWISPSVIWQGCRESNHILQDCKINYNRKGHSRSERNVPRSWLAADSAGWETRLIE